MAADRSNLPWADAAKAALRAYAAAARSAAPPSRLSLTYWLRRWLVPELEPSPAELARREAERAECEAERAQIIAEFDAQTGRSIVRARAGSTPPAAVPAEELH